MDSYGHGESKSNKMHDVPVIRDNHRSNNNNNKKKLVVYRVRLVDEEYAYNNIMTQLQWTTHSRISLDGS